MRPFSFLFILFFFPIIGFSQDHQNIISGNILGSSSAIGLSYERIVGNEFKSEFRYWSSLVLAQEQPSIIKFKLQFVFFILVLSKFIVLVDVGGGTVAYVPFGASFFSP